MADFDIVNLEDSVPASYWRIVLLDIKNGDGVAVVTLKSGVQLAGRIDSRDDVQRQVISLKSGRWRANHPSDIFDLDGGWHVIDYTQVAAITGKVSQR